MRLSSQAAAGRGRPWVGARWVRGLSRRAREGGGTPSLISCHACPFPCPGGSSPSLLHGECWPQCGAAELVSGEGADCSFATCRRACCLPVLSPICKMVIRHTLVFEHFAWRWAQRRCLQSAGGVAVVSSQAWGDPSTHRHWPSLPWSSWSLCLPQPWRHEGDFALLCDPSAPSQEARNSNWAAVPWKQEPSLASPAVLVA